MFRLESLKTLCELRIPKFLSDDNVLSILHSIADIDSLGTVTCFVLEMFNDQPLSTANIKAICYEFLAANFQKICLTDSFRALPRENILDIITSVAPNLSSK